ncbi:hypothetical protein M3Y98_00502300 [Aphelenchoides besseyi]|nr:hypothetical protein M3Y98_00502300 [Aphelenchoides besseyi]
MFSVFTKANSSVGTDECRANFGPSKDREPKERDENYPPRFNVPLHDRRVPEGSLLTIECFVDAKPVAEVSWLASCREKDGKPLPAGIETEYDPLTGACRLKIPNFNSEFTGSFLCKAQNPLGVATTACHLSVEVEKPEEKTEEKESPPKFNPGLEDKSIPAGADLTLTCRVTGNPLPNGVIWNRDGIPLRETDRVKSSFDPETGECKLTIKDAQESEAGVYRALVESRLGSANTSCNVSVKTPKPEVQEKGEGPRFIKGLIDQWIDKGDTLTFTCALALNTTPVEVKWYKNGQLLKPTDRIQIEHTPDGVCRLTIKNCTMSDEGRFVCQASSPLGEDKTGAEAHVDMLLSKTETAPIEEGEAPKFVIPYEENTVVRVGNDIELVCKVTGKPQPTVKFTKDGNLLKTDPRYQWNNDPASGTYKLRIRNANVFDEASNSEVKFFIFFPGQMV